MSTKKNNALSTAGILITPPNSPLTAEEEALAKYYYEMCKHVGYDCLYCLRNLLTLNTGSH